MIEHQPSASVQVSKAGLWEPFEGGIESLLLQVWGDDGSLVDVIAWSIGGDEFDWWLRYGNVTFLGEKFIEQANRESKPVYLAASPKEYLRMTPCACIVDWNTDVRAVLSLSKHGWIIKNDSLRERVESLMTRRLTVPVYAAA